MTVQSVEVDEIREYEAPLSDVCERIEHAIDDAIIVGRLELASGRGVAEEIRDLPDGYDVASRRLRTMKQRRRRRHDAVVAPVRRSREIAGAHADEGPCDHASDLERIEQRARHLAHAIQALETEVFLVRGDLENAVCGRVADRPTRAQVFLTELLDYCRAGRVLVAEHPAELRARAERIDDLVGKGGLRLRKVGPIELDGCAGNLPVAGLRILASRHFSGASGGPADPVRRFERGWSAAARASCAFAEPKCAKVR